MNSDHNVCMDPLLNIKNLINAALKKTKDKIFLIIVMHASSKKKYIQIMRFIRRTGSSRQLTQIYLKGFDFISLWLLRPKCVYHCFSGCVLERANFLLNVINSSKVYSEGLQLTSDFIFKSWCIVFVAAKMMRPKMIDDRRFHKTSSSDSEYVLITY
uniref:Uncharacterized protein n=1 Tax=Glossina austeni TaxID=7395 RepID=A0A1A9VDK5_GLOAU